MPDAHTRATFDLAEADPKPAPTYLVAGVGVVLLVVIVLLLEVLYHRTAEAELYRKVVAEQPLELRSVQAAQREQLNGYRWIDQPQGVVAIPIDRAMQLMVEDAQRARRGDAAPAER